MQQESAAAASAMLDRIRVKTIRSFGSERNDDLMCGAAKDQLDNWWESMKKHYFIGFLPFRGQNPEHSEDVLHGSNMDK